MIGKLRHQVGFDLLMFRRNPAATFFTVILPVVFLVLFVSLFGNGEYDTGRGVATFYVPGILGMAVVSATLVNVAITMTGRRERGLLKRFRCTPLPPWVFIASQVVAALVIAAVMAVVMVGLGWAVFSVSINPVGVVPFLVSLAIGAACFSVMGLALTTIIPSEDAAPAVTNAAVLPLYFISDIFIPPQSADGSDPGGLISRVADFFPIKHLAKALTESFDPFAVEATWPVQHWLVILAWGAVGLVVTLTRFRWTPRR